MNKNQAPFVHVVLFRLPEGRVGEREDLERDIGALLRGLPTVRGLWTGTPAQTKSPDRLMVDDEYDVGLMVLFDDRDALEEYLAHPEHVKFAEKWDSVCTVRVFDFVR